ncbi:hypothetical protein [Sinorhizobium fredii]|uniref:hypothetical protein n=1 Tax=Rhizobium fredii TaxID=380 RepID=UPI0035161F24
MRVTEIFVPNDTPTITYVDRAEHKLQQRLKDLYDTPNMVVSISGPSKSGKTVLIKKVVPEDYLITIPGAGITTAEMLWERALNWMGVPNETVKSSSTSTEVSANGEGGGKIKFPLVAEGEMKATGGVARTWARDRSETRQRGGLEQVVAEIAGSEFVVFIDDFHYIKPEVREEVGRQIKAAAEQGVKIFTASVPHRAGDVVRSNPELRGRVAAVDMEYWTAEELAQIARKGFAALNGEIAPVVEATLAGEAFGSPQLMQSICLNLCYGLPWRQPLEKQDRVNVSVDQMRDALSATSSFTDFSNMVAALHTGAKTRGTERKIHDLVDGTRGDVYRAILLGIRKNPARLSFTYDEILNRVRDVCSEEAPVGSSINSALEQMHIIGDEVQPGTSPISWDENVLDITDPYFLFYLRYSEKLAALAK